MTKYRLLAAFLPLAAHAASLSTSQMDSIASMRTAAIGAYRKGEPQMAADLYRQSIALGDSSIIPFYNLACCYGRLGNYDSCHWALKEAVDRGYPDFMELGTDPDLTLLQQHKEAFATLWQKAFANSFGKTMAKLFDPAVKEAIVKNDTARLRMLLPPEKRTDAEIAKLTKTLAQADTMFQFGGITTGKQLTDLAQLQHRELTYADNHFVVRDEFVFPLPLPYFDADVAQLLPRNPLHLRMHTVDHLYSYLDSLYLQANLLPAPASTPLPQLTDSVMVLAIESKGDLIEDYQEKLPKDDKLCRKVLETVGKSTPIGEAEFASLNPKEGDLRFFRISCLPIKKEFKGIKLAYYAGSKVALVVVGEKYYFVKGKF